MLGALGWSSFEGPASPQEVVQGKKYALLVGVREYKTPALRTLKYSERDIEDLAKVLLDAGFPEANLRILTQERAARGLRHLPISDNIRTELDRMLKLVKLADDPAATVIVALAGHGIMDPKAEKSYFCPADTSAVNLSPDDPALIDLGALYDQLKASPAGFKLMLVDACRNGPAEPQALRPSNRRAGERDPPVQEVHAGRGGGAVQLLRRSSRLRGRRPQAWGLLPLRDPGLEGQGRRGVGQPRRQGDSGRTRQLHQHRGLQVCRPHPQ